MQNQSKPRIRFQNGKWKVFSEISAGYNLDQAMLFAWNLNQSIEIQKILVRAL